MNNFGLTERVSNLHKHFPVFVPQASNTPLESKSNTSTFNKPSVVGVNSSYMGFGGSTGSFTNEHWIHDFLFIGQFNNVNFAQFTDNLQYTNNAIFVNPSIRLTQALGGQKGNVFYKNPIAIKDDSDTLVNWSAYYVFSMGGGSRADGLAFIIQSQSLLSGGVGGGIGYDGITKSIAIGYDSYSNYFDPNNNHVELNVNGTAVSISTSIPPFDMCGTNGTNKYIYNWVDYINGVLNVYISQQNVKPATPILTHTLNIGNYVLV